MKSLTEYQKWLLPQNELIQCRQETPENLGVKTLWIPVNSSNRTATVDLNHEISELTESDLTGYSWYVAGYTQLLGYNGNCGTGYAIIPVPLTFKESDINILAAECCKRLNKTYGPGNESRVLKADSRMSVIVECLNDLFGKDQ